MFSKSLKQNVIVICAYFLLVMVFLGPVDPGSEVWGNNTSDVYNHLYLRHWQSHEAALGRPFPIKNTFLHYPDGVTIFLADAIGGVATIPFVWIFGVINGFNMLVLANLIFGCWAMFFLARRLTGDFWSGFLSGGLFGLCPVNLAHVNNGVTELLQVAWLPLFLACFLPLVNMDRRRNRLYRKRIALLIFLSAGAWWVAAVASHWYFGMYLSLLVACIIIIRMFSPGRKRYLKRIIVAAGLFAIFIIPIVLSFLHFSKDPNNVTRPIVGSTVFHHSNSADLLAFFVKKDFGDKEEEKYLHLGYLGFVIPSLIALVLFYKKRKMAIIRWTGIGIFFSVLAMGPKLIFAGDAVSVFGHEIPMPYLLFMKIIPFFDSMDFPYRFFLMTHLCFALAIGIGLSGLWKDNKWRGGIFLFLLALAMAEIGLMSGTPIPMEKQKISPVGPVAALEKETSDLAVLDLPIRFKMKALNRFVTNQIFHNRPIAYSNFASTNFPFSKSLAKNNLVINLFALAGNTKEVYDASSHISGDPLNKMERLEEAKRLLSCLKEETPWERSLEKAINHDLAALKNIGLTRFMLHEDLMLPGSILPEILPLIFGPPIAKKNRVKLFVYDKPFSRRTLMGNPHVDGDL